MLAVCHVKYRFNSRYFIAVNEPMWLPGDCVKRLLFTALQAVNVTGFANKTAFGDGANPISIYNLWGVTAQFAFEQ